MSSKEPALVAPVMRFVPVSDPARSLAFYRDILGFEEQHLSEDYGMEALAQIEHGPAKLLLCKPRGSQTRILFFEAEDVAAFRNAISLRGGNPSEIQK